MKLIKIFKIEFLFVFNVLFTKYVFDLNRVARIIHDGEWPDRGGSLFPFPKFPNSILNVSEHLNPTDMFIYNVFIQSGLLFFLVISCWVYFIFMTSLFEYIKIKTKKRKTMFVNNRIEASLIIIEQSLESTEISKFKRLKH